MAPPLYFFARKQLADVVDQQADRFRPAALREHGLEETFSDVASVSRQTATNELTGHGPGGASGVLSTILPASGRCPTRLGFCPSFQEWRCAARTLHPSPSTHHELWIGVDREHPPTPEDLLRSGAVPVPGGMAAPHPGYMLTLADGRDWQIPIIRRPESLVSRGADRTCLPLDIGWDAEGRFVETVKPAYAAIWEDTAEICDLFFDRDGYHRTGKLEITVEKGLAWSLRILGLNYRYGRHEQSLLHAVDGTNVFTVLSFAVDAPLVHRVMGEKKTGGEPSIHEVANSTPG